MRLVGRGQESASRLRAAREQRRVPLGAALQARHKTATLFSLAMVLLLLVFQNTASMTGCEAAARSPDLDGKQRQQQAASSVAADQLLPYGQLESAPDATSPLVPGPALARPRSPLDYAMDSSCKSLIDDYRELLLLLAARQRQQQQFANGLDSVALDQLVMQRQRAPEWLDPAKLLQLSGRDGYEEADERVELYKKAGAKHTPRFGR